MLEGRQRLIGDDVDARALAEIDQNGFQGDVVQVDRDFFFQRFGHAAFGALEIEERPFLMNGLAVTVWNVGRVFDAIYRVADVLARRQPAVFLLRHDILDGRIEGGIFSLDAPDFIFQGLGAELLSLLLDPGMNAREDLVLGILLV